MAKRNFLFWGDADAGKSTFAASLMDKISQGENKPKLPPRWPRVDWYNLDKPGVSSISHYFGEGSGARLLEFTDWDALASALKDSTRRAERGDIDAIVLEGLSVYYSNDVGIQSLENPAAVTAGGNAARGLYKAPRMRLSAIVAGVQQLVARAKNPDFVCIITAHSKEVGEDRRKFPDMSRNAWSQVMRLCDVAIELTRSSGSPPRLTYKRKEDNQLLARINHPKALAYFDHIHARGDEAKIAQMRTVPGLVALLEAGERTTIKPDPEPKTTEAA